MMTDKPDTFAGVDLDAPIKPGCVHYTNFARLVPVARQMAEALGHAKDAVPPSVTLQIIEQALAAFEAIENDTMTSGQLIEILEYALSVLKQPGSVSAVSEIGSIMPDGTVCLAPGLYAPAGIFGGKAKFDDQDKVVETVNAAALHGHTDWRRITDDEGKLIADAWDKIAPPALQGRAAPWFWLASPNGYNVGCVRRGGEADWDHNGRHYSLPVPVVRSGTVFGVPDEQSRLGMAQKALAEFDAIVRAVVDLADRIEDHKISVLYCEKCGADNPCEGNDVCIGLEQHANLIEQCRKEVAG